MSARHERLSKGKMSGTSPWKILGVKPGATFDQIKQAFRARVRQFHPDVANSLPAGALSFSTLVEAYRALKKELSPAVMHDRDAAEVQAGPAKPCDGVFLFLEVSLLDAFLGNSIETTVSDVEDYCPACDGLGYVYRHNAPACGACGGEGHKELAWGPGTMRIVCNVCSGSGRSSRRTCTICKGRGKVTRQRGIRIKLPRGTRDGTILKLPGQGPWRQERQQRDTLFVEIRVRLPEAWNITGLNIYSTTRVDLWTALSGGMVPIKTIDGTVMQRCLPSFLQHPEIVLKKRGWIDETGNRGDHIARLEIVMPHGTPPPAALPAIRMLSIMWPAAGQPLQHALPPGGKKHPEDDSRP